MRKNQEDRPKFGLELAKKIFSMFQVRTKGSYTVIPPAFYERDGKFHQPASFEIPVAESAPASPLLLPSSNEDNKVKSKRAPGFEDTAKNIQGKPESGDGNEKVV